MKKEAIKEIIFKSQIEDHGLCLGCTWSARQCENFNKLPLEEKVGLYIDRFVDCVYMHKYREYHLCIVPAKLDPKTNMVVVNYDIKYAAICSNKKINGLTNITVFDEEGNVVLRVCAKERKHKDPKRQNFKGRVKRYKLVYWTSEYSINRVYRILRSLEFIEFTISEFED